MRDFIQNYRSKPWPKLEVPPIKRPQLTVLIAFVCLLIGGGWYIWFSGQIRAEKFLYLGFAIPVLFFLKNRYLMIVGLLSFQVIVAFLFVGNSTYAAFAILGFIGAIIAFESPIIMYMLLIAAIWLSNSGLTVIKPTVIQLSIGAALFTGWAVREILRTKRITTQIIFPEKWPAIFLLVWGGVGFIVWCVEPIPYGWVQFKSLILGIVFFLVSPLVVRDRKQMLLAMMAWIGVGLIGAVATFFANPTAIGGSTAGDAAVFIRLKNVTATILCLAFFISIAMYYLQDKRIIRFALVLLQAFIITAIIYLQSRAAVIGLAIGLTTFWIVDTFVNLKNRRSINVLVRIFVLCSMIFVFLLGIYFMGLVEIIGAYAEIFESPATATTMQFREAAWEVAFDMIGGEQHPIRGLGFGAFVLLAPEYGFPVGDLQENIDIYHTHSLYVDILLHYGIIGLILFLWMILQNLVYIWRNFKRSEDVKFRYIHLALFCSLIGYYVHGILDFTLYGIVEFWLMLGLSVAVRNVERSELAH